MHESCVEINTFTVEFSIKLLIYCEKCWQRNRNATRHGKKIASLSQQKRPNFCVLIDNETEHSSRWIEIIQLHLEIHFSQEEPKKSFLKKKSICCNLISKWMAFSRIFLYLKANTMSIVQLETRSAWITRKCFPSSCSSACVQIE